MAEELKPCPFCGETPGADSYAHADGGYKYGAISCSCGVIGPDVRTGYKKWPEWRDAAVAAWNARAVPAGHVVVSEGLLRRLLDSDGIDGIFDAQQNYAAHQELRALLSEQA
ncbi:Lar family restriction alleviation protein [Pseudomonas aeruginosa]|uniref:Lar family restriction alleviation protein n=1 Tax=Pseudomonas aeruginosa TaxID=287 RepID=UPI0009A41155|nr:Lar family restriction alleviation protein [Pseudomonas aeruginosa]